MDQTIRLRKILSGQIITLGGFVANTILDGAMGFVGGINFSSHLVQYVDMNTLFRVFINSLGLGGTASGAYSRFISNKFNEEGAFFGW